MRCHYRRPGCSLVVDLFGQKFFCSSRPQSRIACNPTGMWKNGVLITAAIAASLLAAPASASATASTGVTATVLWQRTDADVDYVFREITIAPGGSTGWHWHRGQLLGVIKEGTLTHNAADCSVDGIYPAGASIFEPSGSDRVHVGRNLGDTPLILQIFYVLPAGSALSEDGPDPGCGFA
jgi:quercetin dioxygenase-like cupin family protein